MAQVLPPPEATSTHSPWWRGSWVRDTIEVLLIAVILYVAIAFALQTVRVDGESMVGTLQNQDLLLASKISYDFGGNPQRGDIVILIPPADPSQDFIKRLVGLPGDEVVYRDKKITVNGTPWPQTPDGAYGYLEGLSYATTERFIERVGDREHAIAQNPAMQPVYPNNVRQFPGRENCVYNDRGFTCKVPAGNYLMMGDNRDNSDDSRYWGFVPDDHIRGKAFFIWFNWDDISSLAFKRVGSSIR